MDYEGFKFSDYWNQVTPENATKWQSVEGTRGQYNWGGADIAANYASQHGFPFKFHTLVWGSQYPDWMNNLSQEEQYNAVVKWMDAAKDHFPDLEMIDVVNEAISGHAPAPYKKALGGDGVTGYDWIIKAFEMARERWPNAILIYNDYNTFNYDTNKFIDLVKTLRDAGAPIDAYGCQSHDLGGMDKDAFKSVMDRIQNELKMPMYITEYDIGDTNDSNQKWNFQQHFPVMWEADYCAGVTIWGWFYGQTWINDESTGEKGISGLIKDKKERSALKWLREYMQTENAKNAKSPFPGMKMETQLYVKPQALRVNMDQPVSIDINAKMRTKTISQIDFYINNTLVKTLTQAPYTVDYTPTEKGTYQLKAVLTATDGSKYERLSSITVHGSRAPHKEELSLPGTLEFEDFDEGGEGFTYHDSDMVDEGKANYRTDSEGVDIVTGNNGYAIGYTATDEWLEYSVDVQQAGTYSFEAYASKGNNVQGGFSISLVTDGQNEELCQVSVPQTDDNQWSTYKKLTGTFSKPLPAGKQILRVTITGPYCNLDKMILTCKATGIDEVITLKENVQRYNLSGQKVNTSYKGVVIENGKKFINK